MCTIALAWRALADAPVAVAANRDEALDRESLPPRLLGDDPAVVAPQDAEAGGTWIGVSEPGLFVAITNRWTREEGAPELPSGRSRGLLVRDLLGADSAAAAAAMVEPALERADYAGFNLLVADADAATYFEWDGELRERSLEPGVHVIVNPGLNDVDDRAVRLREALAVEPEAGGARVDAPTAQAWLADAVGSLRDHRYGVCIHREDFGTRSSSLVWIDREGRAGYRFADGPPCRAAYEPVDVRASFLAAGAPEERG